MNMIKVEITIQYNDNSKTKFYESFDFYIDVEIYVSYQIQNTILRDIKEINIKFIR